MSSSLYYLIILSLVKITVSWEAEFQPTTITIHMNKEQIINLKLKDLKNDIKEIYVKSENENNAKVTFKIPFDDLLIDHTWIGNFTLQGIFLGKTYVYVEIITNDNQAEKSNKKLEVKVIREERIIDHIFTGSVAILVSILYINFGAALDLTKLKDILRKPVGPCIGFVCQFLAMPLLSFGLGHLIFPDSPELQLGLFFVGVSPAGGASNIWTVILKGNIDLSITMTTISTFCAFGMMPLWIFTLGKYVFEKAELGVPYDRIAMFAIALIIPLGIGLLIQKFLPKLCKILVKIIKPFSIILIIFIVIFAIVTNLYLFEIFSWRIIVAGFGLPWLGYTIGWILAKIFKQNTADSIAISIETGIQNTGIAIFLLRFSLKQPEADQTTVLPVSVAMLTPIPLVLFYIIQKIRGRNTSNDDVRQLHDDQSTESS